MFLEDKISQLYDPIGLGNILYVDNGYQQYFTFYMKKKLPI